ncbi:hypothetical protein AbraIFM66950_007165 [Aspergillus brasiliensis]|nr:hypothetical protein AbraIFM66950_007165 [Aspergillus brasiliensis]
MPWKTFRDDLSNVCLQERFPRLSHLRLGDEDSTFAFTYSLQPSMHIEFVVSIPDATEYPDNHSYFAFAVTDNIPQAVSSILETVQSKFHGCSLDTFLEGFCEYLDQAALGKEPRAMSPIDDDFDAMSEGEDMDWDEYSDAPLVDRSVDMKQLRADLRAAKGAGFKVGYLGDLDGSLIVSVSCRIANLGISQDAMQMWDVCPKQFLVLLLHYPRGYRSLDHIVSQSQTYPSAVRMYLGLCDRYKPTAVMIPDMHHEISGPGVSRSTPRSALKSSFITDPLETLLNDRFLSIVQDRLRHGFSWTGAEIFYNDAQGKKLDPQDAKLPKYFVPEDWAKSTPGFIKADDLSQQTAHQLSLPLIAMQYILRRFVKCTEFCLNCHCKIDSGFEALKPYVCSSPLCLYQYMQLGMGPKLEWEIVTQPYVVDMLVSFAYARAAQGHLTDLPCGLGMKVPWGTSVASISPSITARFDAKMTLSLQAPHNLKVGEWILIKLANACDHPSISPSLCCTVLNVHDQSLIEISQPISVGSQADQPVSLPDGLDVQIVPFRVDFDSLKGDQKQNAVMLLLDTLPDVFSMKDFIESSTPEHKPLASWHDKICPSALYVLRWILASNRSCIVYDEDPEHQVTGMNNYMQFRLAQGSPDKEARFVQELNNSSSEEFPTIFAWHGSPVYNWHSILREGLNFAQRLNGRSFGDGVYMASELETSRTYSSYYGGCRYKWPRSKLDITSAISLNEVINSPQEFRCSSPYYVVPQLDWIQSRYLFVSGGGIKPQGEIKNKPSKVYKQDPARTARGPNSQSISIPISALSTRQGQSHKKKNDSDGQAAGHRQKKRKASMKGISGLSESASTTDDSNNDTDNEDLCLLDSESDDDAIGKSRRVDTSKSSLDTRRQSTTGFQPGTLQAHSFKLLGPPSYATTAATKSLQRHLRATLRIQDREPLHEIGWYVDPTLINNVYQWIVEFHSFDPSLPLAQDLKQKGLTSIAMEMRFPPQFPMSPPFIRVIRPIFKSFQQGGGGHVTAGGAMCMELLTSSGWLPTNSIDSVLLQVRMALCSTEPWPARIERVDDYKFGEAVEAYRRACQTHGWKVPEDFNRMGQA